MANLTLAIDEDLLKQARIRALEQGTSVNALLREYLEEFVGIRNRRAKAIEELLAISHRSTSRRGDLTWPQFRRPAIVPESEGGAPRKIADTFCVL